MSRIFFSEATVTIKSFTLPIFSRQFCSTNPGADDYNLQQRIDNLKHEINLLTQQRGEININSKIDDCLSILKEEKRARGKNNAGIHVNKKSKKVDNSELFLSNIKPIGYLESCFFNKFGTPRQGSICPASQAKLKIIFENAQYTLEGLENYSHVWLIFLFHENLNQAVKPKIRPPQLSGEKLGIFATRTPHRPNPIGLTLCKLERIEGGTIHLSGVDIIHGTPILDVKPYIPAYDNPSFHSSLFSNTQTAEPIGTLKDSSPSGMISHKDPLECEMDENCISTSVFTSLNHLKQVLSKFDFHYSPEFDANLLDIMDNQAYLLEFFRGKSVDQVKQLIQQIINSEPRGTKMRESTASSDPITLQFDKLIVHYKIDDSANLASILSVEIQK